MKTLKMIMLGLVMLSFGAAKASSIYNDNSKLSKTYAINVYVDAFVHGNTAEINDVLDKNVKFSILRGSQLMSYGKQETLEFLKTIKNVEQTCETSTSISETNADFTVYKVDMKYANFTRTNYVTMANTSEGWKITNVYSVFK